jgi:hypothetical protein
VSGLSIVVAAATVVFRDIEHLLVTALLPWFFLTPVFYTFDQLPKIDERPWLADLLHYGNFITPPLIAIRDPSVLRPVSERRRHRVHDRRRARRAGARSLRVPARRRPAGGLAVEAGGYAFARG